MGDLWPHFYPSRFLSAVVRAGSLRNASANAPKKPSAVSSWSSKVTGIRSTRRCGSIAPKAAEIDFSLAVQVGGHDNLAECARFLVKIGIRPEDVDRYGRCSLGLLHHVLHAVLLPPMCHVLSTVRAQCDTPLHALVGCARS